MDVCNFDEYRDVSLKIIDILLSILRLFLQSF